MNRNALILTLAIAIAATSWVRAESPFERDFLQLKAQRDRAAATALAPIEQRYREELKKLLQRAIQGNDLSAALKIKGAFGKPNGVPDDAIEFNGKWYHIYPEPVSWSDARQKCRSLGGGLASVTDEVTHNFIKNIAPKIQLWLGSSDEKTEGKWRWENGAVMQFAGWLKGEPSGGREENYVYVVEGGWRDAGSQERHGFICEWSFR
jgi:hypothetical protein